MPIVTVEQTAGRSLQQRRELAEKITAAFVEAYELLPEQVTIVFHDHDPEDFARSGQLYSKSTSSS